LYGGVGTGKTEFSKLIANKAGVSRNAIYRNFESKDDIIRKRLFDCYQSFTKKIAFSKQAFTREEYVAMVCEHLCTQREIAEHFGFKDKSVVKFALMRARKKGTTIPKFRGRKPVKTLQEYKYENKRLKMENELLRDFLSLTERM
jgi:hypothetical protein